MRKSFALLRPADTRAYADEIADEVADEIADQCTLDRDAEFDACTGLSIDHRQAVEACTVI